MISVANLYLITPELFHDSSTSALLVAQGIAYLMAILRSTGILSSKFLDFFFWVVDFWTINSGVVIVGNLVQLTCEYTLYAYMLILNDGHCSPTQPTG